MVVLAIDLGTVRIGLAVGDESTGLPTPLDVYRRTASVKRDAQAIAQMAAEAGAGKIVVGLPLGPDGEKGPSAEGAEQFAERLRRYTDVPVIMWDERLSSSEALSRLQEAGVSARKARSKLDSVAAAIILEDYLAGGCS